MKRWRELVFIVWWLGLLLLGSIDDVDARSSGTHLAIPRTVTFCIPEAPGCGVAHWRGH